MKPIVRGLLISTLGLSCLLEARFANAVVAIPPYGVELTASSGGGSNIFYSNYGPNSTAGSIPTTFGPNWTGSVNVLTGQIVAGTSNASSELLGYDQTMVEGWNTWTFSGPAGVTINPVFAMTGNFLSTGSTGPGFSDSSPGTGQVCLGPNIGDCYQNAQFITSTPNFNVGLQLSSIANNESVLLSYSLTTTAPLFGTSAIFDPTTGFNNLPAGWTVTGAAGGAAVPEPSTIALLGAGILLMGWMARRWGVRNFV